ncbi:hypothetical protein [Marinifilum sp. N1E240]|uniref:hypothetical protein n=1 Tax=Marinifilum sp. N1E240 TaxID=2608082 RepID=UPI00128DA79E|nr:hypothetical protein [Marinifilum sp. N1E240]
MQQTNTDCLQAKTEVLQTLSNTLQDKSEALQAVGRKLQDELKIFQELRKPFQYTKELSSRQEGSTPTHSFQSPRQETGTYFMFVNGRVIN